MLHLPWQNSSPQQSQTLVKLKEKHMNLHYNHLYNLLCDPTLALARPDDQDIRISSSMISMLDSLCLHGGQLQPVQLHQSVTKQSYNVAEVFGRKVLL